MRVVIDGMFHLLGDDSAIMRQACRDNTYKNPKKATAKEYATNKEAAARMPEEIYIYRKDREGVHCPRGYAKEFFTLYSYLYPNMEDGRSEIHANIPALVGIELRSYQLRALEVVGRKDQGIIEAPTGAGKTIIGLSLMHLRGQRSLILVHNKTLLEQWRKVITTLMGLEVGIIGAGQWQEGAEVTIAIIQTLANHLPDLPEIGSRYGLLMVDECHHVPATTFGDVVNHLPCKYRYGLTATRWRADGLHVLINRYVGDVLVKIPPREVEDVGGTVPAQIKVFCSYGDYEALEDWQDFMRAITCDEYRNDQVLELATAAAETMPTLILTDRIEHAKALAELCPEAVLVHGQLTGTVRTAALAEIHNAGVTIGTFGMLGEGVDVSGWGAVVLATPVGSRARLLQAIGRALRPGKGKTHAIVYDIRDMHYYGGRSAAKREAIYKEREYPIEYLNPPDGGDDEEWDDEEWD